MNKFWKSVFKVVVDVVLNLIRKKAEEKLEDREAPPKNRKGHSLRLLIIVIVGISAIGITAWATKPMELPTDVRIIQSLPDDYNPYEKEYNELLYPCVRITTDSGVGSGVVIQSSLVSLDPDGPPRRSALGRTVGTSGHKFNSSNETYILTASHVVENYSTVNIELYDSRFITASVVITDTNKDLALLRIINPLSQITNLPKATFAPRDYTYYLFTPVYTVGCSLGLSPRPSSGIITSLSPATAGVEVSSPILPGNSGGPVYDANTHELIGIAVWVHTYRGQLITTMAGVVTINQVYDFLDEVDKLISK